MTKQLFLNLFLFTALIAGFASCSSDNSDSADSNGNNNYNDYYIKDSQLKESDIVENIQYNNNETLLRQGKMLKYYSNRFTVYHIVNSTTVEKINVRYELASTSWDNDFDDGNVIYPFYKENIGGYYLYFFKENVTTFNCVKSGDKMALTNGSDAEVFTLNSDGFTSYDSNMNYVKWNMLSSGNATEIAPDSLSNQTVNFGTKINFVRSTYGPDVIVNGQTYSASSAYQKTGSNTGKISFNYTANNVYTTGVVLLTFNTATTGTYEYTMTTNGSSTTTKGNFSISAFILNMAPYSAKNVIILDDDDATFSIVDNSTCIWSEKGSSVSVYGTYTYTRISNTSATFKFTPNDSKYYKYVLNLSFTYRGQGSYAGTCNSRSTEGAFVMGGNY
jgi:hypothetical protein